MARAFLRVFFDFEELTEDLTDEERGRLLLGMLRYAETGIKPEFTGKEATVWPFFRKDIDRDVSAYESRVTNGSKGGRPPKNTEPDETGENRTEPDKTENNRTKPKKTENNRNGEEQEQEQEREINDDDDDIGARAREAAVKESFRENLGREGLPEEVRQICAASRAFGADPEMTREAVRLAAKHNARAPAEYVRTILEEWSENGIRSFPEAVNYRLRSGRAGIFGAIVSRGLKIAGNEAGG